MVCGQYMLVDSHIALLGEVCVIGINLFHAKVQEAIRFHYQFQLPIIGI